MKTNGQYILITTALEYHAHLSTHENNNTKQICTFSCYGSWQHFNNLYL